MTAKPDTATTSGDTDNPGTDTPAGETTPSDTTTSDTEPVDELPEWARKRLTKANTEAANYRTRLREAETRLAEAKTPAEVETALTELRDKNAELERSLARSEVARKAGLPDELAQRLRGETPEELEADARTLLRFAASPGTSGTLRGGLDPSDDEEAFDPVREARRARAARR